MRPNLYVVTYTPTTSPNAHLLHDAAKPEAILSSTSPPPVETTTTPAITTTAPQCFAPYQEQKTIKYTYLTPRGWVTRVLTSYSNNWFTETTKFTHCNE